MNNVSRLMVPLMALSLSACANFERLKNDLEVFDTENILVQVSVRGSSDDPKPIVVVYMRDIDSGGASKIRILSGDSDFEMFIDREGGWLFAFVDGNRDLSYQQGEAYGWFNDGKPLRSNNEDDVWQIKIEITGERGPALPTSLINQSLSSVVNFNQVNVGMVASFDDERFSPEAAEQGLWQPYKSVSDGYAGLFLLEEYDPSRVPIVLVHGINGTPRSFEAMVTTLDKFKYQVWFLNYPSGINLDVLGGFFYQAMELLQYRYAFTEAHVVAHSMGGLVAREYINRCIDQNRCDYLRSYTSIGSPYAGMPSASLGVEYAPTTIPVWVDLSPDSPFLSDLFTVDLPADLWFNLVFTFRMDSILGGQSSDGVVALTSQLRPEAQRQADRLWGIDETHVGVLDDPGFLDGFGSLLVE